MPDPAFPPAPAPSRPPMWRTARVLVPVGAVALAFGGFAIAEAATDSGLDTPHDLAERGLAANPTVDATPPATNAATPAQSGAASETATFDTVNLPEGATQTFAAGAAGTVTIGRASATLSVIAVGTNPGWASMIEQASGPEVEVEFRNGTARIDLEAEFEDGAVRVRVRERTEVGVEDRADDRDDVSTVPAGRVDNSGPGSADSGRDGEDDGPDHEVGDDSASHSGSGSSGSGGSGSGSSGSGHSGSDH